MSLIARFRNAFRSNDLDRELDTEMATHLAERADDLVAKGMDPNDAQAEARRRFGNKTRTQEAAHDVNGIVWIESVVADIRYAGRALRMSPAFTSVAILSLALGIGANTAIFSLINALALRELPVSHPEQLVAVTRSGSHEMTNPLWEQLRNQQSIFESSLAYGDETFNLANGGEVQQAPGSFVSGGYFQALGVQAIAGRLLLPADDVHGCGAAAAVSAGFAARRYGSVENAVGKVVSLNGHPFPIVGVAPAGFAGVEVGQQIDIYAPLCSEAITTGQPNIGDERSRWFLSVLARPKPGMSVTEAASRLKLASAGIVEATLPVDWDGDHKSNYLSNTFGVEPASGGLSDVRDTYRKALMVLMAVSCAVLLIACANIANLLLARAASRQREMAIRRAIGAGRMRLIRQLLTESLFLSIGGAVLGTLFARWASQLLVRFLASNRSVVWLDLSLDKRVLLFTIGIATATGVLFGLAPAWRATRVDPQLAMKSGGRGVVGGDNRQRIGKVLVSAQVALSLALVASAALLVGSFHKLTTRNLGFQRGGIVLVETNFRNAGFKGHELVTQPLELLRRIRQIPGVEAASVSFVTPISHRGWNDEVMAPGFTPVNPRDRLSWFNQVADNYFATLGSRMLSGRDINEADMAGGRSVAVITATFARRVFGSESPLGRTFTTPADHDGDPVVPREVVGVVEDANYNNVNEVIQPTAFYPLGVGGQLPDRLTIEIRSARAPAQLMVEVGRAAASISPAISIHGTTMSEQVSVSLNRPRLLAVLSGFFGGLALLLAMIGLYGTIAYDVAQRRNEIGIRVALGAGKGKILSMVVSGAGKILLVGLAIGVALTMASTRVLSSFLFGMGATDPTSIAGSGVALVLTGIAAAFIPAWRASRLDPMTALRQD